MQMDKSMFSHFSPCLTFLFSHLFCFLFFFSFEVLLFDFPFVFLFSFFSSLKIIRISYRGEHSPKSPPYVWLNSHFLLVIVRHLFSIKSQLFDSFDPY